MGVVGSGDAFSVEVDDLVAELAMDDDWARCLVGASTTTAPTTAMSATTVTSPIVVHGRERGWGTGGPGRAGGIEVSGGAAVAVGAHGGTEPPGGSHWRVGPTLTTVGCCSGGYQRPSD